MSPARRSIKRRDWPRGLYESRPGYYVWRHPDGHALPIGRVPLAVAKNEALAANQHVAEQRPGLVERLTGAANTVDALLERMPVPDKPNTAKSLRSLDKIISGQLGASLCGSLTVGASPTCRMGSSLRVREIPGHKRSLGSPPSHQPRQHPPAASRPLQQLLRGTLPVAGQRPLAQG